MTEQSSHWCESLYEGQASGIILYGRALGLTHSEAEDVLQETFLALMQLPQKPENPVHYCVRAYRNRAKNYRRGMLRRLAYHCESLRWFEKAKHETMQEREAMKCLERLPKEQREVIVLKIWHDYTFEEIGQLLEVSPNTVAGRYRYGLQKIRVCLKGVDYERIERHREPVSLLEAASPFGES